MTVFSSHQEVLEYIEENDVKFIRLAFCDIFGVQKNISIMPGELKRALLDGICFDASAFAGFMRVDTSDLLLFPDVTTLAILPWRPSQGRVVRFFCDIRYPDGTPYEGDGRYILRNAVQALRKQKLSATVGTESEFYLFHMQENNTPTLTPHDHGGYFDIAPLDRGENIRRAICLTLEEMGIRPEASHHEQGPGQHEIDFKYSAPLQAADNLTTYKWVVKNTASSSGLHATFLPKPIANEFGSGMHINMALYRAGKNLFDYENGEEAVAASFIAGILSHAREISLFLNPLANSYDRFGEYEAPRYISWSPQNRSQLVRIPTAHGELHRMELRSPDGTLNPYFAFSLLLHAGLEGVAQKLELPQPCNVNLFTADASITSQLQALPRTMGDAITLAEQSDFIKRVLPSRVLEGYLSTKRAEWQAYLDATDRTALLTAQYLERY